jgi:cytochrome c oxidase assembly protein subunit 15
MFTFPPSKWVGGIFYEHGHRLVASTVGFLTIILAVWLWIADRGAGSTAGRHRARSVVFQGLLGGLTVLFFLPAPISTAHAGLAEIFFCLTVAIALFTSPLWINGGDRVDDGTLRRLTATTTTLIYVQILVGAAMRHTEAGLAIPDFPLMFGHVIPDHWDPKIAVHFAHRVGALVVTLAILATSGHIWYHHRRRRHLARPAAAIVGLVGLQITLGAFTVWTAGRSPLTAHTWYAAQPFWPRHSSLRSGAGECASLTTRLRTSSTHDAQPVTVSRPVRD